ncbi:GAF domain-containing protein [Microbacterium sp. zg.B48]|uniref:GAF domain-containing protein n=1 Tax=Microbacterium sp. zg.B48 TaxID=2969408 RepID=UPI00214BBBD3|nr:GAF domain-containing protein [Microbacterium sp. zg.B48]MCR2762471.1 GAF domain-containing protein [Microbacterium sp. zg.B48]
MGDVPERIQPGSASAEHKPSLIGTRIERDEIRSLVEKERALRDVANLIARAGADVDVIAVIVREASRQVHGLPVTLTQFVGSRELLVLASPDGPADAGMRIVFEADTLPDRVVGTGRPCRVDDYRSQPDAELAARFGIAAGVAVPIIVEGRTWGMFFVSSALGALPRETETLLAAFAQLVTASFDSIEARNQLRAVAEHDETMRAIQHDADEGTITDIATRLVEYAAKLGGIEHATLTALGGVEATATNPVVSITDSSIRPTQTVTFPVTAQQERVGAFTVETTLPALPSQTTRFLTDLSEVTGRIILAITNRQHLSELIDEQASLRRIAELAARGAPRARPLDDILAVICRAASDQLGGQEVTLLQFESADTIVAVATHGGPVPIGVRVVHPPGSLSDRVARTKKAVRVDDFDAMPSAEIVRRYGIRAGVGVPVFIDDRLWGAFVSTSQTAPLPHDTEQRLEGFAQLTWAAIANAEAREILRRLADEQAALRHVAELVARESPLPTVFDAVVKEAARVLNASSAEVVRDPVGGFGDARVMAEIRLQPTAGAHHAEAPILVNGESWGALAVDSDSPSRVDGRDRLKPFADLMAAAIANAEHRAGLTQSRARVIAAADDARRRLQRDVHDGAQQRLVHTILILKLARDAAAAGGEVTAMLVDALAHAEEANRQLRDVVRGILPAALSRNGLAAGIESLAAETPIPVDLALVIPRLPVALETTAYFTVAEAITNAVKHAQATHVGVSCALSGDADELILTVEDDGVGGADPSRGTGLTGLRDRIEASYGAIEIVSPLWGGTRIVARIPLGASDGR